MRMNKDFEPPLRLILTNKCNGSCYYCHKEGVTSEYDMDIQTIKDCAQIAKLLQISRITLTGGEPTLREDLVEIIDIIFSIYPNVKLGLTSNGYQLSAISENLLRSIDTLNMSMTSFDSNTNMKYQGVDPSRAIEVFNNFSAKQKKLNIVVVEDNIEEVSHIIEKCIQNSISVDFMFDLRECSKKNTLFQTRVVLQLAQLGHLNILLKCTPILYVDLSNNCRIAIKHTTLNSLISRSICQTCSQIDTCYERICAVRVYPDKNVTPCLNQKESNKNDLSIQEKIKDIYSRLGDVAILGLGLD